MGVLPKIGVYKTNLAHSENPASRSKRGLINQTALSYAPSNKAPVPELSRGEFHLPLEKLQRHITTYHSRGRQRLWRPAKQP
jgi:hypothetical protein